MAYRIDIPKRYRNAYAKIARLLLEETDWEKTPQGYGYWSRIRDQLTHLSNLESFIRETPKKGDMEPLTRDETIKLRQAARTIDKILTHRRTPQGHWYWSRLLRYLFSGDLLGSDYDKTKLRKKNKKPKPSRRGRGRALQI